MFNKLVLFCGLATVLVSTADAQAYLRGIYEENPSKIDGSCKLPPLSNNPANPVVDMNSKDIRCRTSDMDAPTVPYSVKAGNSIKLIWDVWQKSPVTKKHITGPCSFFLAKKDTKGNGEVWFLIDQVATTGDDKWCSNVIQRNGGIHALIIPKEITAGEYYLRTEISDNTRGDPEDLLFISAKPQFYVDCITLNVASNYTGQNPKNLISIPWDKKSSGLSNLDNDPSPTDFVTIDDFM
ncbi:hypothetical protein GGI20_001004 [Coemansia sp. BCRC 34301]|nr:hypothetical protein GGI20_001004 [Coemansia sp. BCRC 34301]